MSTVLPCVFIFVILSCAQAHSNLADPLPTRGLVCRVGNSQPRDCPGPCPPLDSFGSPTGVNEKNPAATWVRGQSKFVAWQRNNHEGDKEHGTTGFTRLALVPVDKMFSSDAHMQYAFHYACWGAGEHDCPSRDERVCGNDQTGRRYGTTITVPTNYADGVYVLGYSWFGGGDWRASSFFGDYYGCSFIKIQGGPFTSKASPVFAPGQNMPTDGCFSAADRTGICPSEPCLGKSISKMHPFGMAGSTKPAVEPTASTASSTKPAVDPTLSTAGGKSESFELFLVDVTTSRLTPISGKASFKLRDFTGGVNILAKATGTPKSIVFSWNGKVREERTVPFALAGNVGERFLKWYDVPVNHEFDLKVTLNSAKGSISRTVRLLFSN